MLLLRKASICFRHLEGWTWLLAWSGQAAASWWMRWEMMRWCGTRSNGGSRGPWGGMIRRTSLTCQDMDLRSLRKSCGVWHQGILYWTLWVLNIGGWGLYGSDLLQHVLQMLDQIGIWGDEGVYLVYNSVGRVARVKWHSHECQQPRFTSRTSHCDEMVNGIYVTSQWF